MKGKTIPIGARCKLENVSKRKSSGLKGEKLIGKGLGETLTGKGGAINVA